MERNCVRFEIFASGVLLAHIQARPSLSKMVKEAQKDDLKLSKIMGQMERGKAPHFLVDSKGNLQFDDRLCVPVEESIRKKILDDAHKSAYFIHHGETKMHHVLKQICCWDDMKKDVTEYVSHCLTCRQVKAEHQ